MRREQNETLTICERLKFRSEIDTFGICSISFLFRDYRLHGTVAAAY